MEESSYSKFMDSAASTKTLTFVRMTARGIWRTAAIFFVMGLLWAFLQRGGFLETLLDLEWRWRLEKYRVFLGPFLLIPVLISSLSPCARVFRNPLLPGKKLLITLMTMSMVILGVLAPLKTWTEQIEDEKRCKETYLPLAFQLWQKNRLPETLPGCPVQWENSLGNYLVVDRKDFVIVDRWHWHPQGAWGITPQGEVKLIDPRD